MNAIKSGLATGVSNSEEIEMVRRIEDAIKRMVGINKKKNHADLVHELEATYQNTRVIERAILNLIKKEEFISLGEGSKYIQRKK